MVVLVIVNTTKFSKFQKTVKILQTQVFFLFSSVPLRLTGTTEISQEKVILRENPTLSSTCYCRPIIFMYEK